MYFAHLFFLWFKPYKYGVILLSEHPVNPTGQSVLEIMLSKFIARGLLIKTSKFVLIYTDHIPQTVSIK